MNTPNYLSRKWESGKRGRGDGIRSLSDLLTCSLSLLLLCVLAVALFVPPPAHAQVTPTTGDTLNTALLAGATTYNINSTAVAVRKDRGLGILASLTGAATNQATLEIQVSNDKTNWAAATPYSFTVNLTAATTNYVAFTNFPPGTFNNVAWWRLGRITAANTNAITNAISWSIHQ